MFVNDLGIKTTKWAFIKSAKDVQQNKISSQDATKAVRQELNKKKIDST